MMPKMNVVQDSPRGGPLELVGGESPRPPGPATRASGLRQATFATAIRSPWRDFFLPAGPPVPESSVMGGLRWRIMARRSLPISTYFLKGIIPLTIVFPLWLMAHAAELDGVNVSTTRQVNGTALHLNGYGVRTYSILGIHIYAASLYLEHLSTDPEAIVRSQETKLLTVRFEHNVSLEQAQDAWRVALENNCIAPCYLDPRDVQKFIDQIPAMHDGDNFDLLFMDNRATVSVNGRQIGVIPRRQFSEAVLATFLGPRPASPKLKQELLNGH